MDVFSNPFVLLGIFATGCYFLTFITRRVVETAQPSLRKQADENDAKVTYATTWARWWNQVVLYSIAPAWGSGLSVFLRDTEYFPVAFKAVDAALMFGLVAGFLSGFFFKIFKRVVAEKAGIVLDVPDTSTDIPSPPGA